MKKTAAFIIVLTMAVLFIGAVAAVIVLLVLNIKEEKKLKKSPYAIKNTCRKSGEKI
ncbi:MAG: hypothetical protein IJS71_02400 [Clostridia bacterium]|nr:hypothetical protein [Clostridia bacterium]